MKKIILLFSLMVMFVNNAYARVGGGQDYVPVDSGVSSGGDFSFGGGSIITFVVFAVIIYVIFSFLKKKGLVKNIPNPITGSNTQNNPIFNRSVQQNLKRGNLSGALFNAALGGAVGSILSGIGNQMGGATGGSVNVQTELEKIKATDPQFNEQVFKDKAQTAFYKLQEGWEKQDMNIMRPFVSDSILSRFSNQLADLKSRGERNILENIVIGSMDLVNIKSDSNYNYITVKVSASAADYTIDSQGVVLKGSKNPKGFIEFWTFLRTVGVKSDPNKQLKDNKCPNCGASIQINATGKCEYCGAVMNSGQFDWVLSEIKQS